MSRFVPTLSRLHLAERLYGWIHAPLLNAVPFPFTYLKCVLHCCDTSSQVPADVRAYGNGFAEVCGLTACAGEADPDLMQYASHFQRGSMHDLVASGEATGRAQHRFSPLHSRILLYDCMKAASLHSAQVAESSPSATAAPADREIGDESAMDYLARELSVSAVTSGKLQQLCEKEARLQQRKVALLRRSL